MTRGVTKGEKARAVVSKIGGRVKEGDEGEGIWLMDFIYLQILHMKEN
jgi:hypothetical protein